MLKNTPYFRHDDTDAVNLLRRSTGFDADESEAIILSDSVNGKFC